MNANLLKLLILFHLAGLAIRHKQSVQPRPQAPQKPAMAPKGTPSAQGPSGMSQGYQGAKGPAFGGLASLKNQNGMYPHQQTTFSPFSFLAGIR